MIKNKTLKNKKLKIAMIGHKRVPSREGGVEIVVEQLATRMSSLGCHVDIYNRSGIDIMTKENKSIKMYKGCRIITIPTFKNSKLNAIVYSLLATIRSLFGKYDIIHYHAEGPCAVLPIVKLFGISTVATIHGLDWQRAKWGGFARKFLIFGEKMAAKYADEIIVLSKNVQEYFWMNYGRKTVFIPNGINEPDFIDDKVLQEKYGIVKDSYILFLARIVPEKGLDYLIDAYENIATDKKLVIAGGSSHTKDYFNSIANRVKKNDNIVMTGFVDGELLKSLYSNTYLYVLPSDVEGMPLTLLEAMSYNNCCLTSDISELKEVIGDKGITFKKGDITDLTDKLQKLCDNNDLVVKYRENVHSIMKNKYDWNTIVNDTILLYQKAMNKK